MTSGIYIRAEVDGRWRSIDIIEAPESARIDWLNSLDHTALVVTALTLADALARARLVPSDT